jgi:hypothetical protein
MTLGSELFGQILSISDKPAENKPLFELGRVVATQGVDHIVRRGFLDLQPLLNRHLSGDWGEIAPEDWKLNDDSLNPEPDANGESYPGRLFSSYDVDDTFSGESKIWIITEWDRSVTTILLPSEY